MGSYANRHPTNTPVVGEMRRITVAFDTDDYELRKSATNTKYPADLSPLTMRVLPKDPIVARVYQSGMGGGVMTQHRGAPKGMAVLNGYGRAGESKHATLSTLAFLGLSTKEMQPYAVDANTGSTVAADVQGHGFGWNRSDKPIRMGDPIMWDIPRDVFEAEEINRIAGPPTNGAYPEKRYTTFLRAYKPENVNNDVRKDWQEYLTGLAPEFATTPGAITSVRQLVTIGMLIGGALLPSDLRGGDRVNSQDFIAIVKAVMSGVGDPRVVIPEGVDEQYQNVLRDIVAELRDGSLDQYISTLLTPRPEEHVISGKRVLRDTTSELRYINEIQKKGVGEILGAIDEVHVENGRERVIGVALGSAMPGEDFSLMLYGK